MIFVRPDLEKAINSAVFPGMQGGPLMHIIAAKAVFDVTPVAKVTRVTTPKRRAQKGAPERTVTCAPIRAATPVL